MEFKGTKGEWEVKHSESKTAFNIIGTGLGGKYKIARVPYFCIGSTSANDREILEAESDAKLIAVSPEMLAFLIKVKPHLPYLGLMQKECEALIKKATE